MKFEDAMMSKFKTYDKNNNGYVDGEKFGASRDRAAEEEFKS